MNLKPNQHSQEDLDLLFLYVLHALPSAEKSNVEAHIVSCGHCQEEIEMLRPIVASFNFWPTDVLRPPRSLWERLAHRIAQETGSDPLLTPPEAPNKPEWEEAAPGIYVKLLATDPEKHRVSMLVRLAPGTDYPPHRHAGVEELYLLDGVLYIDDKTLYPGDYIRAETNSADHRVWSETGCTCVLLASTRDEIL